MQFLIDQAEAGRIPDASLRWGMRRLLKARLANVATDAIATEAFCDELEKYPIAMHTEDANQQHYEVPAAFYLGALGPRLKYSSAYWPEGVSTLSEAEEKMLRLTCERAGLAAGQEILELGCGWGSLSLWMAEHYPSAHITAVSNSNSQREYIESQANLQGFNNLKVITCDMNTFVPEGTFDRVVSVEMFEHMRNWPRLLGQVHDWLKPGGRLFVHIFTHKSHPYLFETEGPANWMGKYFFTGGMMPSKALLPFCAKEFMLIEHWPVNGEHYAKTLEAWLQNMDNKRGELIQIFEKCYGVDRAKVWFQRWRMFMMACSELFAWNHGEDWMVDHYLFEKKERQGV